MQDIYNQIKDMIRKKSKRTNTVSLCIIIICLLMLNMAIVKDSHWILLFFLILLILFNVSDLIITNMSDNMTINKLFTYKPLLREGILIKKDKDMVTVKESNNGEYYIIKTHKPCELEINSKVYFLSYRSYLGVMSENTKVLVYNGQVY